MVRERPRCTFADKADGILRTWGYNYGSRLGTGTTDDVASPTQIKIQEAVTTSIAVVSVSVAKQTYTCKVRRQ